jgi:hypothetical protein
MPEQNAADVSFCYSIESAIGVSGTLWKSIEPNPGSWKAGAEIKTVARMPVTPDRQERPGSVIDLDAGVEYESDMMYDACEDLLEMALCVTAKRGTVANPTARWTTGTSTITSVTGTGYVTSAGGDWPNNTLVVARGFALAANNGLKLLAGSSTTVLVKAAGLAAETTSVVQNAQLEVCGVQAAVNDLNVVASGQKITSTVLNFTLLPISVGQEIYIGDLASGAAFTFTNSVNRGFWRITAIAAGALSLDRGPGSALVDETGTGLTIRLFYGAWLRPVARTSTSFLDRSVSFEAAYNDLLLYHYSKGQKLDQLVLTAPTTNKATLKASFKGLDSPAPVAAGSRLAGASTPNSVVANTLIATVSDMPRLRMITQAEAALSTDGSWFETVTMTISDNVNPKKYLGSLGASRNVLGRFGIKIACVGVFTDSLLLSAIRNNTSLGFGFCLRGLGDGAIYFDVPDARAGGGALTQPDNDLVTQQFELTPVKSQALYPYAMSISLFPYIPI